MLLYLGKDKDSYCLQDTIKVFKATGRVEDHKHSKRLVENAPGSEGTLVRFVFF